MMKTQTPEERVKSLESVLRLILSGLKGGSIKAKPILDSSNPEAESWPTYSLSELITATYENREPRNDH